jgi:uncharacterized protein
VEFGSDRDELALNVDARELPLIHADTYLNDLLVKYCEAALADRRDDTTQLRTRVENAIASVLPHGRVLALSPDRQDQQNVRKLRGLPQAKWEELVNLIDQYGNLADLPKLCEILDLDPSRQEAEALAARGNMTAIVKMLHDKSSQLMDMLIRALSQGKLCVVDVSQMRGGQSLVLSGLILQRIFDRNQEEFTSADPKTIPTIAVVEEAQSVLNENAAASEPYIAWVKEGRKYDLGALLITQQPGSIPVEILSQGDNWFMFHLLSAADLNTLKRANAHFSDDLLSSLLNEPIEGQGVFWSSVGGKPYPVSLRVRSFEQQFSMRDCN